MKHTINIMPTFNCNYKCGYCYLKGLENLYGILDLKRAEEMLDEYCSIQKAKPEDTIIDIYGGEITLIPKIHGYEDYLIKLFKLSCKYANKINIISNLTNFDEISKLYESLTDEEASKFSYSTSLLNKERSNWNYDLLKVSMLVPSVKSVLVVVTEDIIKTPAEYLLNMLNTTGTESATFLQLVESTYNPSKRPLLNKDYSNKIKEIIKEYSKGSYSFSLGNISRLEDCLNNLYNPNDDGIIYIMPSGYYGVISSGEKEHFIQYKELDSALQHIKSNNHFVTTLFDCKECEFYKKCAADHIKTWRFTDEECIGLKGLLTWYRDNIFKSNK